MATTVAKYMIVCRNKFRIKLLEGKTYSIMGKILAVCVPSLVKAGIILARVNGLETNCKEQGMSFSCTEL